MIEPFEPLRGTNATSLMAWMVVEAGVSSHRPERSQTGGGGAVGLLPQAYARHSSLDATQRRSSRVGRGMAMGRHVPSFLADLPERSQTGGLLMSDGRWVMAVERVRMLD